MKMEVYKKLYVNIMGMKNGNGDCEDILCQIARDYLPSGSGIDNGLNIDIYRSNKDRIILISSFHAMDDNGFYDGWIDFEVYVKPSFMGIEVDIRGKFGKRQDIKDYLGELFNNALNDFCD